MKRTINMKMVVLLTAILTTAFVFVGCQSMEDARHNDEEGRDGISGYALTMQINPSRVPANNNATMQAKVRFVRIKDMAPVANTLVRLMIGANNAEYLDPDIVHFGDRTLLTDVITNAAGEATVTMYVGGVGRAIPELLYYLDAQATIEYEDWNTLTYFAQETFWIYNPHWDGSLPADTIPPTAVITFFPSTGITTGTTITFMGGNSYDRGQSGGDSWDESKAYDEIRTYSWNMGDGKYRSGKTVTYIYTDEGSYTVELMVIDDEGMTGQTTKAVTVDDDI
ncbi:PKD domain-containing protein [bacterium]|nr:PKD domain-containing protein [candidate division CSSED10-310 bacterium]